MKTMMILTVVLLVGTFPGASFAAAQVGERLPALPVPDGAEVQQLLNSRELQSVQRGTRLLVAAFRDPTSASAQPGVGNRTLYSGRERTAMLHRAAQEVVDSAKEEVLAREILIGLRVIALDPQITVPEARAVPRLLLDIFSGTDVSSIRSQVIWMLGDILGTGPAEFDQIAEVLIKSARGPVGDDVPPPVALDAIYGACERAPELLRRLAEGDIQSPEVRRRVYLAEQDGFPVYQFSPGAVCG
jgi:hypothetical protein